MATACRSDMKWPPLVYDLTCRSLARRPPGPAGGRGFPCPTFVGPLEPAFVEVAKYLVIVDDRHLFPDPNRFPEIVVRVRLVVSVGHAHVPLAQTGGIVVQLVGPSDDTSEAIDTVVSS